MNVTKQAFRSATNTFDKIEDARGRLYYHALKLINAEFVLDAHILILATWNTGAFRYASRKFKLQKYQKATAEISNVFSGLQSAL